MPRHTKHRLPWGGHKSDPFLGRAVARPKSRNMDRLNYEADQEKREHDPGHELGERKLRRVIAGRDNISGRRIA